MSDHPIPDSLLDAMARAHDPRGWDWGGASVRRDLRVSVHCSLVVLAQWADGALIDPTTWQRMKAEQRAEWCQVDHAVRSPHSDLACCEACPGCEDCEGLRFDGPCTLVPLYVLTKVED